VLIRHVWASQHGLTREKDLYDRIRTTITSKQRAVDFAKELSDQATVYAALDNPSHEFWKPYGSAVRESIDALNILKATQIRPLVLAILRHFDDKEVKWALPMLTCWTVRFLHKHCHIYDSAEHRRSSILVARETSLY
jgi:hypothetical protein